MDDATIPPPPPPPPPKRSGCLKWTCGCLAVMAVLCVAAVIAGWYALTGWDEGKSAWENLPPGTIFALEAHDVGALLRIAGKDGGALSLAGAALGRIQASFETGGVPMEEELPRAVRELNRDLSWLYTTVLPNYILVGMKSASPDEVFFVVQPPRWFAWTAGAAAKEGAIEEIADAHGNRVFFAFLDGFVVAGIGRKTVRDVLDNWGAQAAPLGRRAGRSDPFCMVALRAGGPAPEYPEQAGQGGEADHFTFGDPFAPPAEALPASGAAVRFQSLLTADESGWNIVFETADAAKPLPPAGFSERMDAAVGAETLEVALPDASDVELALRVPPETLERFNRSLAGIPREFGGDWLRRGVLDGAGGMFALLASRPVFEDPESGEEPLFPPLPVVSLGWSLGSPQAPASFAERLEEWMDALPKGAARSAVKHEMSGDRLSGAFSLPPVLANGARPAWRFLPETSPPTGWLSTDPAGLPGEALIPRLAATRLPAPAAAHVSAAANWDMSRVFIDAAEAFALDRLSQIPDEWFAGSPAQKEDFANAIVFAAQILTAYPGGALQADVNADTGETTGKARIPFGMSVDIK